MLWILNTIHFLLFHCILTFTEKRWKCLELLDVDKVKLSVSAGIGSIYCALPPMSYKNLTLRIYFMCAAGLGTGRCHHPWHPPHFSRTRLLQGFWWRWTGFTVQDLQGKPLYIYRNNIKMLIFLVWHGLVGICLAFQAGSTIYDWQCILRHQHEPFLHMTY